MFFAAIAFLSGCASAAIRDEDLLLKEIDLGTVRTELSRSELRKDIDLLLHAFRHGYAGRNQIEPQAFARALKDLDSLANGNRSFSSASLRDAIDQILLTLPDNHLTARLLNGEESPTRMTSERKAQVGSNVLTDDRKCWQVTFRKKIPIISITRFPNPKDELWSGFKEAVIRALQDAPGLIIDLRGNGGGSDIMATWLASRLFGYEPPSVVAGYVSSLTPSTLALTANNPKYKILRLQQRGKPVPEYLIEDYRKRMQLFGEAMQGKLPVERFDPQPSSSNQSAPLAFNRPIYALIDAGCMSACESMLEAIEKHPRVITVGENTAGSVHYGNMGFVILPNSRVLVQMATIFAKFSDGRYIEKIGYAPKIKITPGTDALRKALEKLNEK